MLCPGTVASDDQLCGQHICNPVIPRSMLFGLLAAYLSFSCIDCVYYCLAISTLNTNMKNFFFNFSSLMQVRWIHHL